MSKRIFTQEDIREIERLIHKDCKMDLSMLPRQLQKALLDLGGVTRKLKRSSYRSCTKQKWIGAFPYTILMSLLPLLSYAGGCGVEILYNGREKTIKERINLIVIYCMESGSGKSVIIKWMEEIIERVREKIASLKYVEYLSKHGSTSTDKENTTETNMPASIPGRSTCTRTPLSSISPNQNDGVLPRLDQVRQFVEEKRAAYGGRHASEPPEDNQDKVKKPKFMAPQIIFEKITLSALVDILGCNSEGRYSGLQLVDEATSIYKNAFDPDSMGKGQSADYFLDKSFLIKLFDGSRIANETKEAIRSKAATYVRRNGLTAFMGIQPVNWIESLMFKDNEGTRARDFTFFAERVKFDARNAEMDEENEDVVNVMSRLTQGAFNGTGALKPRTYQLASDITVQPSVEFDIVDVIFAIYKRHPSDAITTYEVKGAANRIGAVIVNAEERLQENQMNDNLPDWQRRWLGKAAAKTLRLVWPLHVLIHIYTTCRTREDLRNMTIPTEITSPIVAQVALEIYVNSTRTYEIPFEYREAKATPDIPRWIRLVEKLLVSPKTEFSATFMRTAWMYKGKYFNKAARDDAFHFLVENGFAIYAEGGIKKVVTGTVSYMKIYLDTNDFGRRFTKSSLLCLGIYWSELANHIKPRKRFDLSLREDN